MRHTSKKLQDTSQGLFDNKQQKYERYSGFTGLYSEEGTKVVDVPGRPGYIYVRLLKDLSSAVEAYNDTVLPLWGVTVEVERVQGAKGMVWRVLGTDPYSVANITINTGMALLPRHGDQHSFYLGGTGSTSGVDPVWVYKDQFMPLNVVPTSPLSMRLTVNADTYRYGNSYVYFATTGTVDFTDLIPESVSDIRFMTIYLDLATNELGYVTGSVYDEGITITDPYDYMPVPVLNSQITLKVVMLRGGMSAITWRHLYDVRTLFDVPANGVSGIGFLNTLAYWVSTDTLSYVQNDVGVLTNDGLGILTWTSGLPPSGPAGGDLTGTYPDPILKNTTVVPGTYGSSKKIPTFTVNSQGRLTFAGEATGTVSTDDHDHIGGDGAPITEGAFSFVDNTTADSNISKHGLMQKLSGSATQYMGGDGAWHELPINLDLFLNATGSSVAGYNTLEVSLPSGAQQTDTVTVTVDNTAVQEFTASPGLFDFISAQVLHCHLHLAKTAGTKTATAYVSVYHRTSGGTETLMGTSAETVNLTGANTEYDLTVSVSDTPFAVTDRFVLKVFANEGGGGTDPQVSLYYQGTTNSRIEVGTNATIGSPGGSNGQLQYNDGGVFGGVPLVYDDTDATKVNLQPANSDTGFDVRIHSSDSSSANTGTTAGDLELSAGNANIGAGGHLLLRGGDSTGGQAGDVRIEPGTSIAGNGRVLLINPADSNGIAAFNLSPLTELRTLAISDISGTLALTSQLLLADNTFPGSPQSGDRCFRTDLGWLCYYDGTRWLTVHEHTLTLQSNVYPNTTTVVISPVRTEYAIYVTRVVAETHVATTNNGTNYWTFNLRTLNAAYGAGTSIHQFNTSADTVNTWTAHEGTPNQTATPSNRQFADVVFTKVLSPGNFTVSLVMYYRLIVT